MSPDVGRLVNMAHDNMIFSSFTCYLFPNHINLSLNQCVTYHLSLPALTELLTHLCIISLSLKATNLNSARGIMTPCDPCAEATTTPASPFMQHFVPRDVAHLHHVPASVVIPTPDDVDADWNGPDWSEHTRTPPEQKHSSWLPSSPLSVIPNRRASHDTEKPILLSRPAQRQPSLTNPRIDVEDSAPSVCPCCHLRRRSSVETADLRSPKSIHIVLDMCSGEFCPDLSLAQVESPPIAHPRARHSRLCEQQQSSQGPTNAQQVDVQGITILPDERIRCDQTGDNIPSGVQESDKTAKEDEVGCWSPGDFD